MDPQTRHLLEERVRKAVEIILREGVQPYLQGLSHTALLEALENELCFLGLYSQSDTEAPGVIHTLLDQHLEDWRRAYLVSEARADTHVPSDNAPLIHTTLSAASGFARPQETYYVGFMPPVELCRVQQSPVVREDMRR